MNEVGEERSALIRKRNGKINLGRPGMHGKVILKHILQVLDENAWTGFISFRTGICGRLL
jgi:hypothetical protein